MPDRHDEDDRDDEKERDDAEEAEAGRAPRPLTRESCPPPRAFTAVGELDRCGIDERNVVVAVPGRLGHRAILVPLKPHR